MQLNWKKYIWIPVCIVLGYLIWYYLKLRIYDIRVPENPAVTVLWNAGWATQSGINEVKIGEENAGFLRLESDSIIWPEGLNKPVKDSENAGYFTFKWPEHLLKLQVVKVWKNGFCYAKVLRWMPANTTDTVLPWDGNYDVFLRKDNINSKTRYPEIYKENFEENKIVLTLEKPNPVKIVALWENYLISGETDGKSVKITVPRIAAKYNNSLIRVWVCDSSDVSRTCEIPLHKGIVQTRISPESLGQHGKYNLGALEKLIDVFAGFELYPNPNPADEPMNKPIRYFLATLMKDETLIPVLAYGDVRGLRISDEVSVMVKNYFGTKVIFAFNSGKKEAAVTIPLKGEFKHSARGLQFNQKGAATEFHVPPGSWEILY